MKRRNLLAGISTAAVALALCMGITGTAQAAKANDASVVQTEVTQVGAPAAPAISLARTVRSGENVTAWEVAIPQVPKGYTLHLVVYPAGKPKDAIKGYLTTDINGVEYFDGGYQFDEDDTNGVATIYSSDLEPGKYTIEAYLYMDRVEDPTSWVPGHYDEEDDEWYEGYYNRYIGGADYGAEYRSAASNQLSVTAVLDVPSVSTAIKSNSIQLSMGRSSYVTGYEIYRKTGKKFNKIAKTTKAVYTDAGLTADTKYQYKVRSYYYNKDTKAVIYSPYKTLERTTSGSALKLKAQVTGNKNVKLTWTKVPGAIRYEVYRTKDYSDYTEYEKGYNNSFSSEDLLKTLKKNKKTYTDKKTAVNQSYGYTVVAVLKGGKRQVTDYVSVNIAFETPVCSTYNTASGSKVVEWKKVYGATGYLVEKYDPTDGTYKPFKNLGKNTTKVTLPAVTPYWYQNGSASYTYYSYRTEEEYRIRAVKGSSVSEATEVSVYSTLGVVSNVTAKKVSNGIQVSWSSVPGAAYYRVYRVKAGELVRDKDTKTYDLSGSSESVTGYYGVVAPQVSPAQPGDTEVRYYQNYSYSMNLTTQTTMLDYAGMIVRYDGQKASAVSTVGPQEGVAYQYYVVAYAADVIDTYKQSVYNTTTHTWDQMDVPEYGIKCPYPNADGSYNTYYDDDYYRTTIGCAKIGEATYTAAAAPAKVKIKSVKAGSKSATITFKKATGATSYKIYRSTKKKGKYLCVGTTKKTKYKDTKLTSKKTYYYKVVAVKENEVGADVDSAASSPKSVKVK